MPRVVPSQVVRYIDDVFEWAAQGKGDEVKLDFTQVGRVSAIVALAEQVPDHLLSLHEQDYADFVAQLAVLRSRIPMWEHHGSSFPARKGVPVQRIRDLLASCPDQRPSAAVHALTFITSADLRADLRQDIDTVNRGLVEDDWKSATVVAGSVTEALLLWKLSTVDPAEIVSVEATLCGSGVLKHKGAALEKWDLHAFIEVAARCPASKPSIRDDTAKQARIAKDFRNLIHPGRALRLAQKCDRGTALAATAALEMVVRDLARDHASEAG